MKKLFFNIFLMALISCGALYAFNSIQTHKNSSQNDPHAGHDHAEHDHADHADENISTTKQFIPPSERDPNRLWCKEHSVYEDECLICHPEIAGKQADKHKDEESSHAGHDHANEDGDSHEGHDHSDEDGDSHEGHDHADEDGDSHEGHDHADEDGDSHEGHGHADEDGDSHEGHDHSDEDSDSHEGHDHSDEDDDSHEGHDHSDEDGDSHEGHDHADEDGDSHEGHDHADEDGDSHEGHDHASHSGGHIETPEGLFCAEHQVLEKVCGICQPQLADLLLPGESMKVRLPSLQSAQMAGIQIGTPLVGNANSQLEFLCEIKFNESAVSHISPLANGVIQKVYIDYGDLVEQGQVLFEVSSTEIAKAKSDYLKAIDQEKLKRITFEREKELNNNNISAKQDFQLAEAEFQVAQAERMTAHQQLINYGLMEDEIEIVRNKRLTSTNLKLRAPFTATLIDKHAVLGESVSTGEALLKIADLTTMWLMLTIPESQISSIQLGDMIEADFSNIPGITVKGKIDWVSPQVNENTRMVQARAIVNNEDGKLRQGFFGNARIVKQNEEQQILVPIDSLQQIDGKPYVFIKEENDLFELRRIVPGVKFNQQIAVLSGISADEQIVIDKGFTLKSEFLKSRFGAGCAHE